MFLYLHVRSVRICNGFKRNDHAFKQQLRLLFPLGTAVIRQFGAEPSAPHFCLGYKSRQLFHRIDGSDSHRRDAGADNIFARIVKSRMPRNGKPADMAGMTAFDLDRNHANPAYALMASIVTFV